MIPKLLAVLPLLAQVPTSGVAQREPPPVLRGRVTSLVDKSSVPNVPVRLLEPDVEGATDEDGIFAITLPRGWRDGDEVTIVVRVGGQAVLRPWDGKLNIPSMRSNGGKTRPMIGVIVADSRLVAMASDGQSLGQAFQPSVATRIQLQAAPSVNNRSPP
jgi:hypothetical protein